MRTSALGSLVEAAMASTTSAAPMVRLALRAESGHMVFLVLKAIRDARDEPHACARIAPWPTRPKELLLRSNSCPEELREPAVAYLLEQAEKYRTLKELIQEGMDDLAQGRATEWSFEEFLREARAQARARHEMKVIVSARARGHPCEFTCSSRSTAQTPPLLLFNELTRDSNKFRSISSDASGRAWVPKYVASLQAII